MKITKFILFGFMVLLLFPMNISSAADTNGPLTFTSFQIPALVYRGSQIGITGSGFNHVTDYWLVPQNPPIPTIIYPDVIEHTDTQLILKIPANAPFDTYGIQLSTDDSSSRTVLDHGQAFQFMLRDIPAPSDNASPTGTNVVDSSGTVYRIESSRTRSPYTSAGAFLSYRFNSWATVKQATAADLVLPLTTYYKQGSAISSTYYIPPRNGSLINDNGTVYLTINGLRAGFILEGVFTGLGYSFKNVHPGDTSFMYTLSSIDTTSNQHRDGTLINANGTLYVMKQGSRVGFPSMPVLESWGYWPSEAVPANSNDLKAPINGVVGARPVDKINI